MPLLAEVIILVDNQITVEDIARIFPEFVLLQLAFLIPISVVAAITPNLSRFFVVALVSLVVFHLLNHLGYLVIGRGIYGGFSLLALHGDTAGLSRTIVCYLLTVVVGSVVFVHQYLSRKTIRSGVMLALALVLVAGVGIYWQWDFLAVPEPTVNKEIFDPEAVVVSVDLDHTRIQDIGPPLEKQLGADWEFSAVPPGFEVVPVGIASKLSFSDGKTAEFKTATHRSLGWRWDQVHAQREKGLQQLLGVSELLGKERLEGFYGTVPPPLIRVNQDTYDRYEKRAGVYSADLELRALKYEIVAELPLVKGSRYDKGSEHAVITNALGGLGIGCTVVLKETTVLRFLDSRELPVEVQYLLHNKRAKQALVSYGVAMGREYYYVPRVASPFYLFSVFDTRFGRTLGIRRRELFFGDPESGTVIDDAWLADAKLVRVEIVPVGRFSKSVRLENFVMDRLRGVQSQVREGVGVPQ